MVQHIGNTTMIFYEDFPNGEQRKDTTFMRMKGSGEQERMIDCRTRFLAAVSEINYGGCKGKTLTLTINSQNSETRIGIDQSVAIGVKTDREAAFIAQGVFDFVRNKADLAYALSAMRHEWITKEDEYLQTARSV